MAAIKIRQITSAEKAQGFTNIVLIRSAEPSLGRGSVEIVDPATGRGIGTLGPSDLAVRQLGGRKFKGQLFVRVAPEPEVRLALGRKADVKLQKELAEKEATFEAKRIAEGKIRIEDVVLTQRGSRKLLRQKLAEAEAQRPGAGLIPREKEVELSPIQERIKGTLEKQGKDVRFEDGQLVFFEEGRKTIITKTGASVVVPPSAEVSEPFLESEIMRRRKAITVRPLDFEPEELQPEGRPLQLELPGEPTVPGLAEELAAKPIQQTMTLSRPDFNAALTLPPVSEIRAAPKPEGFLEKGFETLKRKRFELFRERARGRVTIPSAIEEVGVGLGLSLLMTGAGAKALVKEPVETTKRIGAAVKIAGTRIITGVGFPEVGQIIRESPGVAVGFVAGEIAQAKLGGAAISVTSSQARRLIARVSPRFKPVVTEPLGIQKIKGVKLRGKEIDIGLIPKGKGLKIDVDDFLKQVDIPLAKRPAIPRVTPIQRKVLKIVRERGEAVTGSFAQRVLLEPRFTRRFADIDVAAVQPRVIAGLIKGELGKGVAIRRLRITDSPVGDFNIFRIVEKKTGRVIADIDPLKFVEEGLAARFRTVKVAGIEFIDPQARLLAKAQQLARGKTKGGKVARDITALTGGKVRLDTPLTRGAFKFTQAEKSLLLGKKGTVTTSARDFFKILQGDDIIIDKEGLFATPFDPKTLEAQTRITRLGLEQRRATLVDILTGDFTFKRPKPQIVVFPEQKIGEAFKITPGPELQVLAKGGTIVRKQGKLGTTIINKKVVPIFEAGIIKSSKELQRLTKQARAGKISTVGKRELGRLLAAETGFDVSGVVSIKPLVSLTDVATDIFIGATKLVQPSKQLDLTKTFPITTKAVSQRISEPPSKTRAIKLTKRLSSILSQALTGRISTPLTGRISAPPSGLVSFPPSGIVSVPPSIPHSVPPRVPPITPPPTPPTKIFIPTLPELKFPREKRKRKEIISEQIFAFTPDFIASVLGQFGPAPTRRRFVGQERRFRIRGKRFVSPLPRRAKKPLSSVVLSNVNALLGMPQQRRPRRKARRNRKR